MKKNNKSLKIAIIGWGSLVNNKKSKLSVSTFKPDGPEIPLEFSRISKDGRLVPIIDEKNGTKNKVFWALSKHRKVSTALDELIKVENIGIGRIGVLNLRDKHRSECTGRQKESTMAIAAWAQKNNIDVVLWNSLGTKFKEVIELPYSVENALNYLNAMPKKQATIAKKYIDSVPAEIKTKFRDSLVVKK